MDPADKQLVEMLTELNARSKARIALEAGFFAVILSLCFVGNSITLLIMVLNRRMRVVPANMFVASLAISDFSLAALSSFSGFVVLSTSHWPFSNTFCQYQGYMAITLAIASMQTLAMMAVNRYFRIVSPKKYRRYFSKKKTMIIIFVAWLYSFCAPLPYVISGNKMVFHPSKFFCYLQIDSRAFTTLLAIVYVGFPTFIIIYCYLRIFKTVRSHNNNFQTSYAGNSAVNVEEIKVARTLFVIVVFFNLCWTPVFVIDIVDTIQGSWIFPREAYVAYSFLATISSALNPMIYGVLNKNFQDEYLKILRCRYSRSQTTVKPLKVENGGSVLANSRNNVTSRCKTETNTEL